MTGVIILIVIGMLIGLGWKAVSIQKMHHRELGRFSATIVHEEVSFEKKIDRWFEMLGRRVLARKSVKASAQLAEKNMNEQLKMAGLESVTDQGKFLLVRLLCYLSWPIIALIAWRQFPAYYATVTSIFSFAIVVIAPHLYLSRKSIGRIEDIQRELPLVIDLTNLATSAGWDVGAAFENVIDALAPEFPKHPLFKELKRARWLANSGYTWQEALDRVSKKLNDDTVTRVSAALVQAIDQGGDRSQQLSGIADDAQRTYYAALDKRLAAVPVKALIIMVILFLTYFVVILAPALVGITNTL
jgi:Flp pilus assembly protein TadB